MAGYTGISWDIMMSDLVQTGGQRVLMNLERELEELAGLMEAFAKANHPWQNQTGEAERTFTCRVVDRFTIEAQHGVYYGVYLEYRWGGRWGVIPMTIEYGKSGMYVAVSRAWQAAWTGG